MKILAYLLFPFCLTNKVVNRWNAEVFNSKNLSALQEGRASAFTLALFLSPVLILGKSERFLPVLVSFIFIVFVMTFLMDKLCGWVGCNEMAERFISGDFKKASFSAVSFLLFLILWALTFLVISKHG